MKLSLCLVLAVLVGLACGGGGSTGPTPQPPPPPPEFILLINGPGLVYAGEASKTVSAVRAIESSEPINWTLEGPGTLTLDRWGTQPASQGGGLYYIPPATVPGGGDATAKLYYTTKDLYYGGMKKSPEQTIQVKTLIQPMAFQVDGPASFTATAGGVATPGAIVSPVPFFFDSQSSVTWTLGQIQPAVPDAGTLVVHPIQVALNGSLAKYTAPATVPRDFDVTITATTHDPWFNRDPVLTWTIHVKKPQ